ncbi:MAG TPA: hypothetical protein VMF06_10095 [Candidatus Limnocylindria bacterium]|jgi:hypothetical protein|nr:hypothetical protein [Candidatus Limnocylindria bacterium]
MENDSTDTLSRRVSELSEELDSLRSTIQRVLFFTLLGTVAAGGYVFQNYRTVVRELELNKSVAVRLQEDDRSMALAATKLKDFGHRNPDFVPYLTKYGLKPEAAPAAAPATAPVAPKK